MSESPTCRYDMPAVFGPSRLAAREFVPEVEAVVVTFETTREAIERLLPAFYRPGENARVSLSRMVYRGVSYLGMRGYEELVVGLDAVYDGPDGYIAAPYMPVLWVSDVAAITAGRELMGYAKVAGELPPVLEGKDERSFSCLEFGTRLLSARAYNLAPLSSDALGRINRGAATSQALGWKYIPAVGGGADADYPTLIINRWEYAEAWSGEGSFEFFAPSAAEAPTSARIVAALAQLPVVTMRRSFVARGTGIVDRAATRRLRLPADIGSGLDHQLQESVVG